MRHSLEEAVPAPAIAVRQRVPRRQVEAAAAVTRSRRAVEKDAASSGTGRRLAALEVTGSTGTLDGILAVLVPTGAALTGLRAVLHYPGPGLLGVAEGSRAKVTRD